MPIAWALQLPSRQNVLFSCSLTWVFSIFFGPLLFTGPLASSLRCNQPLPQGIRGWGDSGGRHNRSCQATADAHISASRKRNRSFHRTPLSPKKSVLLSSSACCWEWKVGIESLGFVQVLHGFCVFHISPTCFSLWLLCSRAVAHF
jgi:hypothetical protein